MYVIYVMCIVEFDSPATVGYRYPPNSSYPQGGSAYPPPQGPPYPQYGPPQGGQHAAYGQQTGAVVRSCRRIKLSSGVL